MTRITITAESFDPYAELRTLADAEARAGACASFIGYCRGEAASEPIRWLQLEHYAGFTERELERLGMVILERHDLMNLLVVHRVGRIMPGEPIVLVAALSTHRAAALAAVEQMMDYLKTDAPFWKQEMRDDGAHWIEPTQEDRRRRAAYEE